MTSHPAALSTILSIYGSGKLSLGQALLRLVKSMHIRHLPLFLYHDYVCEPRMVGNWFDEIGLKQAVYFSFGSFCFFIRHFAQSLLLRAHRRVDAQTMLDEGATDPDQVEAGPGEDVLISGETGDEFLLVS
jgi:hypothetical protein